MELLIFSVVIILLTVILLKFTKIEIIKQVEDKQVEGRQEIPKYKHSPTCEQILEGIIQSLTTNRFPYMVVGLDVAIHFEALSTFSVQEIGGKFYFVYFTNHNTNDSIKLTDKEVDYFISVGKNFVGSHLAAKIEWRVCE